ncbi:MAG: heavy metal-binding domain-containing protein [Elusimicrobiota bacterium]
MKKYQGLWIAAGLAAALLCAPGASWSHCGSCGVGEAHAAAKDGKLVKKDAHVCPMSIKGAETKFENTADGIIIRITSKDKAVVEKIQAAYAKSGCKEGCTCKSCLLKKKDKKPGQVYVCPMGCHKGHAPGKCPKCGMKLKKKE